MKVNSYNFQNISIMRGKTEGPALFGREYCKKGISARNEVTSIEASISILIKIWTVFLCVEKRYENVIGYQAYYIYIN